MRTIYTIPALLGAAFSTAAMAQDAPPSWSLHGFGEVSFKNDYVTPRGLVVHTAGETVQVLDGLVLVSPGGIALTAGTWTDINPGYNHSQNTTALNEFDFFFGVSGTVARKWKLGVQYVQFVSGQPNFAFKDEHNIEFSVAYDDNAKDKPFAFNPYAKFFWAFDSKSSTVVLGKAGGTFDVELGAVPTYKAGAVTLAAPTWLTVGPKSYWGAKSNGLYPIAKPDGNLGVFSTGLKVSTPLSFIKGGAGANIFAQVQYYYLINDNLRSAKQLLNGGTPNFITNKIDGGPDSRSHVVFGVGMGFGF